MRKRLVRNLTSGEGLMKGVISSIYLLFSLLVCFVLLCGCALGMICLTLLMTIKRQGLKIIMRIRTIRQISRVEGMKPLIHFPGVVSSLAKRLLLSMST